MLDFYFEEEEFLEKNNSILICGPTALGKTSLAVKVAKEFSGEILSADSRQLYRGMDIGTGKDLSDYEQAGVKTHLIDIADPQQVFSLYKYLEEFYKSFIYVTSKKNIPVICGGSGLYIEAAIKNYEIANVPEDSEFRNRMMNREKEYLKELLGQYPRFYNSTDLSSKKRIVRALEIAKFSKHSKVEFSSKDAPEIKPLCFLVSADKDTRIKMIDIRLEKRLEEGMIEEVQYLLDSGVTTERMNMFGLEYKYVTMYLLGKIAFDEMKERLKNEIHRFSKRQMTWFRGMEKRGIPLIKVDPGDYNKIKSEINKSFNS